MTKLTHLDNNGVAQMVDVGNKAVTPRTARADGFISMHPETLALIQAGTLKKGDVFSVARLAGIMAAKKTADLIPLCHSISLSHIEIVLEVRPEKNAVYCSATARTMAQTGVEMEALTAVQISLLTIYDMCKSIDRGMQMNQIQLQEKHGGKSGDWARRDETLK